MKKTIYSLIAGVALVFGAASCSENGNEPVPAPAPVVNPDGTQAVTLTAKVPGGIRSRAAEEVNYGDGQFIGLLDYAVFEGDSKTPVIVDHKYVTPGEDSYTVTVNLNPQKKYKVYFFAQHYPGTVLYTVDFTGTEHYCDVTRNAYSSNCPEKCDAFSGLFDITAGSNTFTLTRPVAQVTICTDEDLSAFDLATLKTRVGLSVHPHQYNEVDKGIDKTTSGLATITEAYSKFDGAYMMYAGRKLNYLFVDYVFPYGDSVSATIFFSDASGNIGTKQVAIAGGLEANTHYIIMPKSGEGGSEGGGSIVGNNTEFVIVKDTNFSNTTPVE